MPKRPECSNPLDVETNPGTLRSIPAFGGLDVLTLGWLLDASERVHIPCGELLFAQGDAGHELYILERGRVEAFKTYEDQEFHLREMGPGDCVGELALLAVVPRSASVRALDEVVAIKISNATVAQLYDRNLPQFTLLVMNLGREVCRRFLGNDERLFQLALRCGELEPREPTRP